MKATVAFYRDILGFSMPEAWPDKENPMWANFVCDKQSVMAGTMPHPDHAAEMGCGADEIDTMRQQYEAFQKNAAGVGIAMYFMVPNVDGFYESVKKRGGKPQSAPKSQFYGLRDFRIQDPTGYTLHIYSPITLTSCQSCAMPLKDAKPGQMYCQYCLQPDGTLRPYEQVFEGTVSGYFMGMQKMDRKSAEHAAHDHLAKQPAWKNRAAAKK